MNHLYSFLWAALVFASPSLHAADISMVVIAGENCVYSRQFVEEIKGYSRKVTDNLYTVELNEKQKAYIFVKQAEGKKYPALPWLEIYKDGVLVNSGNRVGLLSHARVKSDKFHLAELKAVVQASTAQATSVALKANCVSSTACVPAAVQKAEATK